MVTNRHSSKSLYYHTSQSHISIAVSSIIHRRLNAFSTLDCNYFLWIGTLRQAKRPATHQDNACRSIALYSSEWWRHNVTLYFRYLLLPAVGVSPLSYFYREVWISACGPAYMPVYMAVCMYLLSFKMDGRHSFISNDHIWPLGIVAFGARHLFVFCASVRVTR